QLQHAQPIHSLHIGNDGAAFVEVLVGSSSGGDFQVSFAALPNPPEPHPSLTRAWPVQVLLPSAALMSPSESRAGAEPRRVRLFGPDSLVKAAAQGGRDRLRVVLSQPYCQSRPYGLSFVRVFAAPGDEE
ncbi:XRCC1 protein, partial [Donacobius atricapilla]|nr:XRCC1 protein [Donacobius atricapilla]